MVVQADAPVSVVLDAKEWELFRQLRRLREHGYGHVVANVQAGHVSTIEYTETIKPGDENGAG